MFLGCFTVYNLPGNVRDLVVKKGLSPKDPFCLIFNTMTSPTEGEHWIAVWGLCYTEEGYSYAEYFDPTGIKPGLQPRTTKFLEQFAMYEFNTKTVQDPTDMTSTACGYHCIWWLLNKWTAPFITFDHIVNMYPNSGHNLKDNDLYVIGMIENDLKTY